MDVGDALINLGPDGVVAFDRECRYTLWNPVMERLSRLPAESVLGRCAFDLFPFLRATGEDACMRAALEGRTVVSMDRSYRIPQTGRVGFFQAHYAPLRDATGAVIGAFGVIRDMTERRRTEAQQRLRTRVNDVIVGAASLPEAITGVLRTIGQFAGCAFGALWEVDRDAALLRCVATWAHDSSLDEFEAVTRGRTFRREQGLPGSVWAANRPLWIREVAEDPNFPRAPVAGRAGLHSGMGFVLRSHGRPVGVFEFFSRATRDADDQMLEIVADLEAQIGQLVERKRAEAAVRDSEERFRQIAENIREIFYVTDVHPPRLLYISPAYEEIWGRPVQTLYDDLLTFIEPVHPEDRARVLRSLDRQNAGEPTQEEYRLIRPDGEIRHVLDRAFPLRDGHGVVYRVVGVAMDITDRRRAEQALEEASRRKDEFLATLGHELRNPLAPILTAAELLRAHASSDPVVIRAQEMIRRQGQHMRRLLDDLLDVSRITRGIVTLRKQVVDVAQVVTQALQTARPLLDERQHALSLTTPSASLRIEADPTRLEQVITNLLSNAAKFTPPGGQISVTVEPADVDVVIRVRDSGKGIPPDMLTRIFDLFTQANPTIDRAEGGLGIGLTLVRRLIEMHGGTVSAHSEGAGTGSEFVVRVPSSLAVASVPAPTVAPDLGGARALRVLVVDDNVDAADALVDLLQIWGHETEVAHTGPEALNAASRVRPDVVLLDIGLPGMDGYEVARRLQQDGASDAVLIALTGYGQEEDRRRSQQAGFSHHITKPVEPDELEGMLRQLSTATVSVCLPL